VTFGVPPSEVGAAPSEGEAHAEVAIALAAAVPVVEVCPAGLEEAALVPCWLFPVGGGSAHLVVHCLVEVPALLVVPVHQRD
jgi:1-acyl-sn-glycerol-3-phosphate acyltransferase